MQCRKCQNYLFPDKANVFILCPECQSEWYVLSVDGELMLVDADIHRQSQVESNKELKKIDDEHKQKIAQINREAKNTKKKKSFLQNFFLCFNLTLLLVAIICGIYACNKGPKNAPTQRGKLNSESGKIDAWVHTQYLVEARLHSPRSAKFPFGGAQKHVEETASGIYIIRSYVDAKNAFGAEIRQHFFCKLQRKPNGKFELIQLTFQ